MILCVGPTPALQRVSIHPHLTLNEPNVASRVMECAAGKAVNAGRVLASLSERHLVLGFVGGETGEFIRRDLDVAGVAHDFVTVESPTRTCVTLIDEAAGTATEIVEKPLPVEARAWEELLGKVKASLGHGRLLVLSGSLPPGGPEDFYAECVAAARSAGVPTILDARGAPLVRAIPHGPLLVKPNRAELAETVGFAVDSDAGLRLGIRRLIADGAQWAAITLGAAGCVVSNGRAFWRLTVPRVKPVSAVGSGDAFTAGLAAAFVRGLEPPQASVLAGACGVSNALNPLPGHIRPEEVSRFEREIRLEPMPDEDEQRAIPDERGTGVQRH